MKFLLTLTQNYPLDKFKEEFGMNYRQTMLRNTVKCCGIRKYIYYLKDRIRNYFDNNKFLPIHTYV